MLEWMEESSGGENNSLDVAYSCPLSTWASMNCCKFILSIPLRLQSPLPSFSTWNDAVE